MSETRLTQYGFVMGPVEVKRLHRDDKYGAWIELETERGRLTIRVTKTGHFRIFDVVKKGRKKK